MTLTYYNNYLTNIARNPNQAYLQDAQAFNQDVWNNSTQTWFSIQEEDDVGAGTYHLTYVSVDMALDLETGNKKSDDWKIFSFRDLGTETKIGLMYKYANNYWLSCNTDELAGATKSVEVRRCNNFLKWIDPNSGHLNTCPCVIDYSIQSPQPLKDKDIATANGHIVVWTQGNTKTLALTKNQRFIFNGQPYKLSSYNNMLQNNIVDVNTTILYYDMYLDMAQPTDDLSNNIANATDYEYAITLDTNVNSQVSGYTGQVFANVTLNGNVVNRSLVWSTTNATINAGGSYTLTGTAGSTAIISCYIEGNPDLVASTSINIVATAETVYDIMMNPVYTSVRVKQPVTFNVSLYKDGVQQTDAITYTVSGASSSSYNLVQVDNNFTLTSNAISSVPLTITFSAGSTSKSYSISLKALF